MKIRLWAVLLIVNAIVFGFAMHDGEHPGLLVAATFGMLASRGLYWWSSKVEPPPPFVDQEIIICAAIRLPDGRVFRGHRHGDAMRTAHDVVIWNQGTDPGEHHWHSSFGVDQGFMTSRNRYVGCEEALELQLAAYKASAAPGGYRPPALYSEDLY